MNTQANVISGSFRRNWVVRILSGIRNWHLRQRAMQELAAMPDSLLNDLGISRYQIADVVNQRGAFAKLPAASTSTSTAVVAPLTKAAA